MIQLTKQIWCRFINPSPGKLVRKLSLQVFIIFRTFFLTPENTYVLVKKTAVGMELLSLCMLIAVPNTESSGQEDVNDL